MHYPAECECEIIPAIIVTEATLFPGSRFALSWLMSFQLAGSAVGAISVIMEMGVVSGDIFVGPPTTGGITWTEIHEENVPLTALACLRSFALTVTSDDEGEWTGAYTIQGQTTDFELAANVTAFRARLGNFDSATIPDPRGCLTVRMAKGAAAASIIAL